MKLLIPVSDLKNHRNGIKSIPCACEYCGTQFLADRKNVARSLVSVYNKAEYCSKECRVKGINRKKNRESIQTVVCDNCGKNFLKTPCAIKKTKHNFCSHSCAATYGHRNKTKGTRVSKFEIYCQTKLPVDYPNLEFHFNRKDAIGSELDIFIPVLRLAFELNGIVHYEPIYGQDKLDQIQSNDQNKFHRCYENRISLCIIDTSSLKYNVEKRFVPFYEKIKEIIDKSLIIKLLKSPVLDSNQ